jgi:indole-3-glycerol phosphate synthase
VSTFLEQACASARERVADAARQRPVEEILAGLETAPRGRLARALRTPGVSVIAEVKRASPSRGHIAVIPDAAEHAQAYVHAGAAAVSVLTEPTWFKGSLHDLASVAAAVDAPVLRKDFIVDGYQVWEAASAGASALLLIVAALDQPALASLLSTCDEAGLDALVEVHDVREAERAQEVQAGTGRDGPLIVGVNARDLQTLEVDPDRFATVRDALDGDVVTVAESGVRGPDDVRRLAGLGAHAVLVGESVAAAGDPREAVAALVAAGRPAVSGASR